MRLCLCVLLFALLNHGCATQISPPPAPVPPAATDLERRLQAYEESSRPLREQAVKKIPEGKTPEEQAKVLERRRAMLAMSLRAQLDDAFRAAGYPPEIRARYVRKIRQKIQEGLALETVAERRDR